MSAMPPRSRGSIDIIVPTHVLDRPVERAIGSVLADGLGGARAILVCHGVPSTKVLGRVPDELLDRVTVVEHTDGIPSAAGPFNAGLALSDAEFVGVMGSDDFLQPGALAAWRAMLQQSDASVVLARVVHQNGGLVRTPPTRLGRRSARLDWARDRLAYRTAPLGLMRSSLVAGLGLRFEEHVATAEDLGFGIRLLTGAHRVDYARRAPAYVVGADAVTRVTQTPRPVAADLQSAVEVTRSEWFCDLSDEVRHAAVVKIVRIHVFGAVFNRRNAPWPDSERASLAEAAAAVEHASPSMRRVLSVVEDSLWRAIVTPSIPATELVALAVARTRHGHLKTLVSTDPRRVFDPQAPIRLMVASALMR